MKKVIVILSAIAIAITAFAQQISTDSVIGRPLNNFSTTAFCSYNSLHPSQYIVDNNWDILCAFRTSGPVSKLDSLNIPYNKSQLRFLMVGDLLSFSNGVLKTKMPIFDKQQTTEIRNESKAFADSIFPSIEPKLKELISAFGSKGYKAQIYSLIFSYLLDGYIWSDGKLIPPKQMESHGTWSGAYWAMYDKRSEVRNGTNGYGPLKVNWTDELGYWPGDKLLLEFARYIMDNGILVKDNELKDKLCQWNLVDSNGQVTIPIINRGNQDDMDILCNEITIDISSAIKRHCATFATTYGISTQDEAQVIFYHEVMWDLFAIMESKGLVVKPAILKGEDVGKKHFADITFIVLGN